MQSRIRVYYNVKTEASLVCRITPRARISGSTRVVRVCVYRGGAYAYAAVGTRIVDHTCRPEYYGGPVCL